MKGHLSHKPSTLSASILKSLSSCHLKTLELQNPNRYLTMSEPTNLVPNLNEIMEEYAEWENETVQATQAVAEQGEERDEVNRVFESIEEESRKKKRRTEKLKQSRELKK